MARKAKQSDFGSVGRNPNDTLSRVTTSRKKNVVLCGMHIGLVLKRDGAEGIVLGGIVGYKGKTKNACEGCAGWDY